LTRVLEDIVHADVSQRGLWFRLALVSGVCNLSMCKLPHSTSKNVRLLGQLVCVYSVVLTSCHGDEGVVLRGLRLISKNYLISRCN